MKSFKKWMAAEDADKEKPPAVLWYLTADATAEKNALLIIEEGATYQLDNRYSARFDIAHQPNQRNHTHVYLKGNEVCVVNDNGTPSHGSPSFSSLPRKIQAAIKARKLVESSQYLTEEASASPPVLISRAAFLAFWVRLLSASS